MMTNTSIDGGGVSVSTAGRSACSSREAAGQLSPIITLITIEGGVVEPLESEGEGFSIRPRTGYHPLHAAC